MSSWHFTQRKYLSLTERLRHKKAGELLKEVFLSSRNDLAILYRNMEQWLSLPPLHLQDLEEVTLRFHVHMEKASISLQEHAFLTIKHQDTVSHCPFLSIEIVLDSLQSAFNVGSILRTTEAFRLGHVHFLGTTPTNKHPKVQKASMNTYHLVPSSPLESIQHLPRPWIALETASPSTPLSQYTFPPRFTLILGNETHGISKDLLLQCDAIVEIPLYGGKNSLNVASAFAIAAAAIRLQLTI